MGMVVVYVGAFILGSLKALARRLSSFPAS